MVLSQNLRKGAHFTNVFSLVIQIRRKLSFVVVQCIAITPLQIFANTTTTEMSGHVLNVVVINALQLTVE